MKEAREGERGGVENGKSEVQPLRTGDLKRLTGGAQDVF